MLRYFLVCWIATAPLLGQIDLVWPTQNTAFIEGRHEQLYLQPTSSGKLKSALFGCVRNEGTRFHEGLDLKSIHKDNRGNPRDEIFAIMDGRIAYINQKNGRSGYGIYIIAVHDHLDVPLYSLYAHLGRVRLGLKAGDRVVAGESIGIMGYSASYRIPRERAHLHLEIGLRLTDNFQAWYDSQPFKTQNYHSIWNGMNLIGLDPVDFYQRFQSQEIKSIKDYLDQLESHYALYIKTDKIPNFVKRYPKLLEPSIPLGEVTGWKIEFTAYGLPIKWIPLSEMPQNMGNQWFAFEMLNEINEDRYQCTSIIEQSQGTIRMTQRLHRTIALLFL